MFLLLSIVFIYSPEASANAKMQLYSVTGKDVHGQPYRLTKGGDPIGNIPTNTVIEVSVIDGDWAKVKYKGAEYYMWAAKLKKAAAPKVVVSPWAKKWFANFDDDYYGLAGEWKNAEEDWTKPITRDRMARIFVMNIMEEIYDPWVVQFTLKGAFKGADELKFTDAKDYYSGRLLYWGVVPQGKFNGNKQITYGEYTELLVKLMAYDKKINREGGGLTFTKKDIEKFAIGGNTKPDAKITMEQAKIIGQKTVAWWEAMNLLGVASTDQKMAKNRGVNVVGTGVYSIRSALDKQPNFVINKEGKGELRNGKNQNFKITYKKNYPNMMLYTIQTMDGQYVALAGGTKNGNRVITQKKEYLWVIESENSYTHSIHAPLNKNQKLNASEWKTADGTHVITWFVETTIPDNARWRFDFVEPLKQVKVVPNPA